MHKAYVVKENFDGKFRINDVVFVGEAPEQAKELGLKFISEAHARALEPGFLEPAVDADVQAAAVQVARAQLQAVEDSTAATDEAVSVEEQEWEQVKARREARIKELRYRAVLAHDDLTAARARFDAILAAFDQEATAPFRPDDRSDND